MSVFASPHRLRFLRAPLSASGAGQDVRVVSVSMRNESRKRMMPGVALKINELLDRLRTWSKRSMRSITGSSNLPSAGV